MVTLEKINRFTVEQFVEVFGGIFEDSPWVAEKAALKRPFPTLKSVYEEMKKLVENTSLEEKERLILKHPELGNRISMSEHSVNEQAGAGLNALTSNEYELIMKLNKLYRDKFNFPFIIAVTGLDKHFIMKEIERRLQNDKSTEFTTALNEIYKIARIRFENITA